MGVGKTINNCCKCGSESSRKLFKRSKCPFCVHSLDGSMERIIPEWAQEEFLQVCKEFNKEFSKLNGGKMHLTF